MFRRYVDKLKKDKPCCPLCHRGFQEDQESQDLIIEVSFGFIIDLLSYEEKTITCNYS